MELERAIDILDEMKKCNIKPSMSSYSELIDLAVTFEEPEIAYELLLSAKLLKDFAEYEEPLYLNVLRSASYHYKVWLYNKQPYNNNIIARYCQNIMGRGNHTKRISTR